MSTQQRKPHASYHYVCAINDAVNKSDAAVKRVLRKLVREAVLACDRDPYDRGDHNGVYEASDRIAKELVR